MLFFAGSFSCQQLFEAKITKKCAWRKVIEERTTEGDQAKVEMEVQSEKAADGKRLDFLASALKRYSIYREEVSPKMNIGVTTIYYWLSHDDCFISYMYLLAQVTGLKFVIKITPKQNIK